MTRRFWVTALFFLLASFLTACSSPWKVVRQADPNPFDSYAQFKAMQLDFSQMQFDGDPNQTKSKEFSTDKSFMARDFQRSMLNSLQGKGIKIFTGKAAPNIFVIRPMLLYLRPGTKEEASKSELTVQLLKNNKILDVIKFEASTKPDPDKPATMTRNGRMRADANKLGEYVAKYLIKRVGK